MGRPRALNKLSVAAVEAVMAKASSISDAATKLGVNKGTVSRWVAVGKVPPPGQVALKKEAAEEAAAATTAEDWGKWVRQKFVLTRNELELVQLAEMALAIAKSKDEAPTARLNAMTRFQALLNHLNLEPEAKGQPSTPQQSPARAQQQQARKAGSDPRALLMAVK